MADKQHSESLKKKIAEDIEKTGYPAELIAGKIFDRQGWELRYNVYYIDEDERKGREIDIVAGNLVFHKHLHVHVECWLICAVKKSSKPWIIFSTEATGLEAGLGWDRLHISENVNGNMLPSEKLSANSTIERFRRFGHAYYVAFQANNSSILDALSSAVKGAEQHRRHHEEWFEEDRRIDAARGASKGNNAGYYVLILMEPLVILDGQLFEAYLDKKNKLVVKKINHIPVCFGYVSSAYTHAEGFGNYMVEIVTLDALSKLVSNKERWIEGLWEIIAQNISKAH